MKDLLTVGLTFEDIHPTFPIKEVILKRPGVDCRVVTASVTPWNWQ